MVTQLVLCKLRFLARMFHGHTLSRLCLVGLLLVFLLLFHQVLLLLGFMHFEPARGHSFVGACESPCGKEKLSKASCTRVKGPTLGPLWTSVEKTWCHGHWSVRPMSMLKPEHYLLSPAPMPPPQHCDFPWLSVQLPPPVRDCKGDFRSDSS
jgi:hypothetical protein